MKFSVIRSILILSGSILLLGLGVVLPTLSSLRSIRTDISSTQILMERQYQQRQELRETVANLQMIRDAAASLNVYAIREGEELRFIQSLEDVAARNRVTQTIQLVTANQKELSAWEKVIPLTIALKGSFHEVLRYLRDTETLPYIIHIDAINLKEVSSSGDMIEVRLTGRVHWLAASAPDFVWGEQRL